MKNVIILAFICCCFSGFAQQAASPEHFAASITAGDLQQRLYIIAGKEMEGRETATPGQRKAAAYIENYFRSLGLLPGFKDSYQQHYPVYRDSIVKGFITVNDKTFEPFRDFIVSPNSSHDTAFITSAALFAGYGISDSLRDDYKDLDARGKMVLVLSGIPPVKGKRKQRNSNQANHTAALQEAARKNGAIGLLIIDHNFPRAAAWPKGSLYIEQDRDIDFPNTFYISEAVAQSIMGPDYAVAKKAMKKGKNPQPKNYSLNMQLRPNKVQLGLESSNVLAYIEGTDKKEEAVIITAHYDHLGIKGDSVIYYGADDDGSGVSAVLEIAEAFAKSSREGSRPRRSIIFMTVSGEEKGLWGSSYYSENPAWPLDKTTVNLNIDMIGRVEKKREKADLVNYLYVIGDNRLSSDLRPISEKVNDQYSHLYLDYRYNAPDDPERIFYRSDHYNFARKGVPVIFYFSGLHDDYHRPTDTPDKIKYDLLAKRTQFIFYTAWDIANREDFLKRDLK